jgi:uncharacterized protein involved in exopolysaccharide biosynthesis
MKDAIPYQPELDALDWRTSLRRARHAITRHVLLIAVSCAIALLLLFLYEKIFPPIYKAEAVIQGEPPVDVVKSAYYANWNIFRKGDQKSEPELVTSGRVAREVVTSLNLKFPDVHHSFLMHLTYLWTDSWVGKKYRAFKEWLSPPDPAAYKATPEEIEMARTIDALKESISVESTLGTIIAHVTVKAPTYRAGEIANRVVDAYLAERSRLFREEAQAALSSLQTEVDRAAIEIKAIDQLKFDFDTKNKVVLDFEKDKLVVGTWASLQSSINDIRASIASLDASLEVLDQQIANEPREIINARTLQDSKIKGMLQAREFELHNALLNAQDRYAPGSPEVLILERSLAETREALKREPDKVEVGQERVLNPAFTELRQRRNIVFTQLAANKASLAEKNAMFVRLEKRMDQVPGLIKDVIGQNRNRESLELRYKLLRERAMQAEISLATLDTATPSVRVIDYATPPMKAYWPRNIILIPAALAVGLLVGFALALLAEMFSTTVNRDRLASRADIPVYAVIDLRPSHVTLLTGPASNETRSVVERLRRLT